MKVKLKTILYEERGQIAFICINMPPANKMIPQFLIEFTVIIKEFVLKTEAIGVVICGEGRHFSSGADIDELLKFIKNDSVIEDKQVIKYPVWYMECKQSFDQLYQLKIPVISAIRGFCIGSGLELALSSHIRICEVGARIGLPESTFGLLPGVNGTLRLSQEIGVVRAFEMILKGDLITSEEAYKLGIVDLLVPKRSALDYAIRLIEFQQTAMRCHYNFAERLVLLKKFKEICLNKEGRGFDGY